MSTIEWKRRYRNDFLDRLVNDDVYRLKLVLGSLSIVLIIWAIIHMITYRETVPVTVQSIGWDTKIDVLQYMTVQEGGWHIPIGGRETNHYLRQSGTKQTYVRTDREEKTVKGSCSTDKKGKRTCAPDTKVVTETKIYRTDPVYSMWYEYDIDRWENIQPLIARGNTHEWYYPDTSDGTYIDTAVLGNKKLGMRYSHFFVALQGKDKIYQYDYPEDLWKGYTIGDNYKLTLGFFGNLIAVEKAGVW